MKTFAVSFSALLVLSNAQDASMLRGKGRGGGRGKGKGGKGKDLFRKDIASLLNGNCYWGGDNSRPLLERIEEECESYTCSENSSCGAGWQNMVDEDFMVEGCPDGGLTDVKKEEFKAKLKEKKETWMGLSKEERQELREEKKAIDVSNAATVLSLGCGCCGSGSENALADIVRGKEGAVARTLGFRKPKGEGGLLGQLGSKPPKGEGGLLGQLGSGFESGEGGGLLGQIGNGDRGDTLGQSGNGEGGGILGQLGSGSFVKKLLEGKCPTFKAEGGCESEKKPDCSMFDAMLTKRDRKGGPIREFMLHCGCCPR